MGHKLNYEDLGDEIKVINQQRLDDYYDSIQQLNKRFKKDNTEYSEALKELNEKSRVIEKKEIRSYTIDELNQFIEKSYGNLLLLKDFFPYDEFYTDAQLNSKNGNNFLIKVLLDDIKNNIKYLLDFRMNKSKRTIDDNTNRLDSLCRMYQEFLKNKVLSDVKVKPIMVVRHDLERIGNSNRGIPILRFDWKKNTFTNLPQIKQVLENYK